MNERWIRGRHGTVRMLSPPLTKQRLLEIREWREMEGNAGRPSGLIDYLLAHDICTRCKGDGVEIVEWIEPRDDEERESAKLQNLNRLALYGVCSLCAGSGKGPVTS